MTFSSYYGHSDRSLLQIVSSLDTGYHECGWASIRIMFLAGTSAGKNLRSQALYFVQVRHLFRSEQEKKEKRKELYVVRLSFHA